MEEPVVDPVPAGVTDEVWAETHPSVKAVVREFRTLIGDLSRRLSDLEEKVRTNSSNSSKPPSSDGPGTPRGAKRPPSGRPKGGQKGHPGFWRATDENPDRVVDHVPDTCTDCGGQEFTAPGSDFSRHQVTELEIRKVCTEHRFHQVTCLGCGRSESAPRPESIVASQFGPNVEAAVGYMTGFQRSSRRDTVAFFRDVCHINLSLGSIVAMEKRVSTALKGSYDVIAKAVTASEYLHMDETSWLQAGKRCWLWVATDKDKTLFKVAERRTQEVAKGILQGFQGVLHSDRYAGYGWYPLEDRALCHAHVKRD